MLGGFLVMGLLGAVSGLGLAIASKVFYVYVDPKIEEVEELLPGANCGGCGYPGCSANAQAIVAGESSPSSCVACGEDVIAKIAEVLGVKLEAKEPEFAKPGCKYGVLDADVKYIYDGIKDCRAATLIDGGAKTCPVGCLGLGTCVNACPFDALSIGPDRLPVVDMDRCTGCGTCERVCPKHIITLTSNSLSIMKEYTTDQCTAPCQRACPAGVDIPSYIRAIKNRDYETAIRTIKLTNPLPAVCGRICVHPCEYECRRNLVDEPVAINDLKRFVSDYERNSGKRIQVPRAPETDMNAAIIGGGAEGLTAAYLLNRLGHNATIYEASDRLGGILRIGIPENRLPHDVLDWEIDGILDAGVKAVTGKKLGQDITIASLLNDGNSAVFVATGGWDTIVHLRETDKKTDTPLPGVQILLDFLLMQNNETSLPGDNIVILEGGKSALDAARICINNGAKTVSIVLRADIETSPFSSEDVKQAEGEGIRFYFGSVITKMEGEENSLTHVLIKDLKLGAEEKVAVDTLLVGTGRFPELIYVRQNQDEDAEENPDGAVRWETLSPYPGPFAQEDEGIFRPGEVISDYKAVVEAIGSGRRAANSVHRFFKGMPVEAPVNMIRMNSNVLNIKELEPIDTTQRQHVKQLSLEEQSVNPSAEICQGFSEEQAIKEANRCLDCGLICYRRVQGKKTLH